MFVDKARACLSEAHFVPYFKGRLLKMPIFLTKLTRIARDKHYSLFARIIKKEKKV
jgi:hypothetical protein